MKRMIVAAVVSISLGLSAAAQDLAALLRLPGSLDSLAQEIGMKISGAKACRIERRLPAADIAAIVAAMRKVDSAAVDDAFLKVALIVRGLGLVPGGAACRVIAEKIDEAVPIYAKLAAAARN